MAQRIQFIKTDVPLVVASHTTIASVTVPLNGILRGVKAKTPAAVDGSATVKVDVNDADGDNVYTKSGIAVNTTNKDYFDIQTAPNPLAVPVAGTYTIITTYSATQATNRTTTVTLLMESYI
jgi:hypothetical protein